MEKNMLIKVFAVTALLGLSMAGLAASSASASGWRAIHPRRAEVNGRLNLQSHRIAVERREGDITPAQARDLHAQDHGIRTQERLDASQNGGHITRAEQRALNQQENAVSQQIGR
jgi:hypothetical protein